MCVVSWEEAYRLTQVAEALELEDKMSLMIDPEGSKDEERPAWAKDRQGSTQVYAEFEKLGIRKVWCISLCVGVGQPE